MRAPQTISRAVAASPARPYHEENQVKINDQVTGKTVAAWEWGSDGIEDTVTIQWEDGTYMVISGGPAFDVEHLPVAAVESTAVEE